MITRTRGFTLLEAMAVLALLAILAGVATPSLGRMIHAQQLRAASIELATALSAARHAAIARRQPVLVDNGDGDWTSGWRVFVDHNGNGVHDGDEPILRQGARTAAGVRISGNTPVSRYVRYTPTGRAKLLGGAFQAGTISLCHVDGEQAVRRLVLSASGRLRTQQAAAGSC